MSTMSVMGSGERARRTSGFAFAAVGVATACAGVAALLATPIAARLTAGLLPGGDCGFAADWVRNIALALTTGGVVLVSGWRRFTAERLALARWAAGTAVLIYAAGATAWWWYINDDAGITFTYVRNFVAGHGLVYNVGDPPLEGYSNPLWLGLLAVGHSAGLEIALGAKVLGLVCGAVTVLLLGHLLRAAPPLAWLALPLAATNAAFVIWTNSGLENAGHALLLLGVVALLAEITAGGARRAALWGLSTVLALLVLSRPEGTLFTAVSLVYLAVAAYRRQLRRRAVVVAALLPALTLAGLLLFRMLYFHDWLPNTFYAKAGHTNPLRLLNPLSGGWLYVASGFAGAAWTVATVPVLMLLARREHWTPLVTAAVAVIGGQLFFVVSVGGDWMGESRFLSVVVPPVSLLIGLSLAQLPEWPAAAGAARWRAGVALAAALLMILTQTPRVMSFAAEPTTSLAAVGRVGAYFADLARRSGLEHPTLAHHDAGGTTFLAGLYVIDLGGLCDRTIARFSRDPARIRQYLFEERRPMFVYSGPAFAKKLRLEEMPELQRDYVPLPAAPCPEVDGYLRYVRRDLAGRLIFENAPAPGAPAR